MDLVIFLVTVFAALWGLLAVVVREDFLIRVVNPYRKTWLIVAAGAVWVGIGLLRLEAQSWDVNHWLDILIDHFSSPRIKVTWVALLIGLFFSALVVWVSVTLAKDPGTFYKPEHRHTAFKYYVELKGGLHYAALYRSDGDQIIPLEEAINQNQVKHNCPHLPNVPDESGSHVRKAEDQVAYWRELAKAFHKNMEQIENLVHQAHQGDVRELRIQTEFGGIFFKYIRHSHDGNTESTVFLFCATLASAEMDSRRAPIQFRLLVKAMQSIQNSISQE